jgi:hypothetical protein
VSKIKRENVGQLLLSNSIIKISPSFATVFTYYLTAVLRFTTAQFSLKSLTAEIFFLCGIFLLNTAFRSTSRGRFVRVAGILYMITHLTLIPVLYTIDHTDNAPGLWMVLIWTGMNALFYEIFYLPIVGIFLEICPQNLEGFFMSMILLLNNFSRNVGQFLGTLCIYFLGITATDFSNIYLLIFINCMVGFIGVFILRQAHIPEKPVKRKEEEEVGVLENNYLAYINTIDSMYIPKGEVMMAEQVTNHQLISKSQTAEAVDMQTNTVNSSIN